MQKTKKYLAADKSILSFHKKVQCFGIAVNKHVAETRLDIHSKAMTARALHTITADIFVIHRAVLSLCSEGWSSVAPIVLRTMLELYLSIGVITKSSDDSEYYSFRYLYNFWKKELSRQENTKAQLKETREQIDQGLSELDENTRGRARDFIEDKFNYFWYKPEYKNPIHILKCLGGEEFIEFYGILSSATHGGQVGLQLLKGQPEDTHPNPRKNVPAQNMALVISSRIMMESFEARGRFEGAPVKENMEHLRREYRELQHLL